MSLNITSGTAPCSWGVWWADGTPSGTPYNVFLDQASEAGYKALELGPAGYLPTDDDKLEDELNKRNLKICGGTACYDFIHANSLLELKGDIDILCKRLNRFDVPWLMTMDGASFGEDEKKALGDQKKKTYRLFAEMGKYCKETYGITVLIHPERHSLVETREELEELIDMGLFICFDNGHYAAANGGWQQGDMSSLDFFRAYHERIPYLHFKNVSGKERKTEIETHIDPGDDIMCDLDSGIIDYIAYRDLLDELNFSGVGIIEQDCPHATTSEAFRLAKKNLNYLKNIGMIK